VPKYELVTVPHVTGSPRGTGEASARGAEKGEARMDGDRASPRFR